MLIVILNNKYSEYIETLQLPKVIIKNAHS